MVYARDFNLNNNGVIHPETSCASAKWPSFPLLRKGYTSIEQSQRQAPVIKGRCAQLEEGKYFENGEISSVFGNILLSADRYVFYFQSLKSLLSGTFTLIKTLSHL